MHSAVSSASATAGNSSVTVQALKEFAGLHHELTEVQAPHLCISRPGNFRSLFHNESAFFEQLVGNCEPKTLPQYSLRHLWAPRRQK